MIKRQRSNSIIQHPILIATTAAASTVIKINTTKMHRQRKQVSPRTVTPGNHNAFITNNNSVSNSNNVNNNKISSSSRPVSKKQRADILSPASYVQTMFGSFGISNAAATASESGGVGFVGRPKSFLKPKQEDIDAYDLEAVRAIRSKDLDKLRQLYASGKNLNACNQFGESLLHMACRRGDIDIVKFMVCEAQVNVEIRDDFGRNPFHDACWTSSPNYDVMDVLISVAPDLLMMVAEDVRGSSPFEYARREHYDKWVAYLVSRKDVILARIHQQQQQQQLQWNFQQQQQQHQQQQQQQHGSSVLPPSAHSILRISG